MGDSSLYFKHKIIFTLRNYYPNSVLLAAENIFIYFTQHPRFRDVYSVYSVYRVSRESRAGRAAVSWSIQTAVSHASTISRVTITIFNLCSNIIFFQDEDLDLGIKVIKDMFIVMQLISELQSIVKASQ